MTRVIEGRSVRAVRYRRLRSRRAQKSEALEPSVDAQEHQRRAGLRNPAFRGVLPREVSVTYRRSIFDVSRVSRPSEPTRRVRVGPSKPRPMLEISKVSPPRRGFFQVALEYVSRIVSKTLSLAGSSVAAPMPMMALVSWMDWFRRRGTGAGTDGPVSDELQAKVEAVESHRGWASAGRLWMARLGPVVYGWLVTTDDRRATFFSTLALLSPKAEAVDFQIQAAAILETSALARFKSGEFQQAAEQLSRAAALRGSIAGSLSETGSTVSSAEQLFEASLNFEVASDILREEALRIRAGMSGDRSRLTELTEETGSENLGKREELGAVSARMRLAWKNLGRVRAQVLDYSLSAMRLRRESALLLRSEQVAQAESYLRLAYELARRAESYSTLPEGREGLVAFTEERARILRLLAEMIDARGDREAAMQVWTESSGVEKILADSLNLSRDQVIEHLDSEIAGTRRLLDLVARSAGAEALRRRYAESLLQALQRLASLQEEAADDTVAAEDILDPAQDRSRLLLSAAAIYDEIADRLLSGPGDGGEESRESSLAEVYRNKARLLRERAGDLGAN